MKEHKRTEEQQKDLIFDIFSKCRSETAVSRLQVHSSSLCEQIYLWYKDYLPVDIDKMGLEIVKVISRFTKDENILKIPYDKDGFFKYLSTSIKSEKAGSYREYNENDTIRIPKEKKRKLKDFIKMKESQLGRELTNNECIQGISKWFKITEKKASEYFELINNKNVSSLYVKDNNGKEQNILDTDDFKPPYLPSSYKDPESAFFASFDLSIIKEAIKSLLDKKQERSRPCYKALFTLYCIKNDLRGLYPILDQEIIDSYYKDTKKPKQYEIYMKYHSETDKKGADAMASKNLSEFLNEVKSYLKDKNK